MRVCMISGLAKHAGGLEKVVDELSNFLVEHNVQVTILGRHEKDFMEISENRKILGLRPYNILPPQLRFARYDKFSYSLKVWRKIKKLGPFNIVHGHGDNCFFPSLFRDRTPFIMTFHGTMKGVYHKILGLNKPVLRRPRSFPLFYPEKVAAESCDLAIACSKAVRDELITLYKVKPAKIKVIYNGVDTEKFRPIDKKRARNILGLPEKKNYAIWVGTNAELKGLSVALKAAKGLKNTYLLVVGIFGISSENIIFWGRVNDYRLLLMLYNAADFLIFPTMYEGFPLVPLEAMACGIPIIVSKESNMGEIISEGVHGFIVKDRNPLSYKDRIELLINDTEMLNNMAIQCRSLAMNYSWEKQAKRYWEIYKRICANN